MKLPIIVIPVVAAVTLLAVACDEGDTIVQAPNQSQVGVSATGTGRAVGEPDVAVITVGVNVERESVEEAREAAASAQQGVIESLKANGVADEDIQTVQFSVYPQYDYRPNEDQPRITGYVVNNVVTAKVRDLDVTGKAIDDATVAGGNDAVVQGVTFTIDDPEELREQARQQAVALAKAQAQQLADAAGANLGKLISISESGGYVPFDERAFAAGGAVALDAAQAPTPIEPGELEITITVNLLYSLE